MNHTDHVNLLRPASLPAGGTWADLGAGTGAFTLALRDLVGPQATIHAVDKDGESLRSLSAAYAGRFGPQATLQVHTADLLGTLELPPLDGVLMANSLHFQRDKIAALQHVRELLKPGGVLLLVEYNVDHGNPWVPYPLSYTSFEELAARGGFRDARLLATHPSSFLREFYAAMAVRTP